MLAGTLVHLLAVPPLLLLLVLPPMPVASSAFFTLPVA
jgi:hypothetical protein